MHPPFCISAGCALSARSVLHWQALPFQQVQHNVTSLDCHPTTGSGVLVLLDSFRTLLARLISDLPSLR